MEVLWRILWVAGLFAPLVGLFGALIAYGWARETGRYTFLGAAAFGLAAFLTSMGLYLVVTPVHATLTNALRLGAWADPWLMPVLLAGSAACVLAVAVAWRPVIRRVLLVAAVPGVLLAMALGAAIIFTYRSEIGLLVVAPAALGLALVLFMVIFNPRLRLLPNEG